jgi:hypothetical protein
MMKLAEVEAAPANVGADGRKKASPWVRRPSVMTAKSEAVGESAGCHEISTGREMSVTSVLSSTPVEVGPCA